MTRWPGPTRGMTAGVIVACVVASLVTSAIATSMDVLGLLLVALLAGAALAAAIVRPELLFYAYCVAIPFNFALPPGPAGTVARIAGMVFFLGYLVRRPGALRPGVIPLFGWLFIGWTLASGLWAIDSDAAFSTWLSVAQLFAITLLIASLVAADTRILGNALWAYALSATVTAAIGCIEYLQSPAAFLGRAAAFPDQDPALFASLILPAAIVLMGEIQVGSTKPALRLLASIALAVCIVALAISGTRSAWLGLIVATVAWLVLQREARQLLAVAAVAITVTVLVVTVPDAQAFLLGRASTSLATGGSGRTDIWNVGLSILASGPLIGVGFGNFSTAFTPYAISQATASLAGGALYAGRAPHNVLLGTAVETGLAAKGVRGNVIRVALISLYVQAMFLDILQQKQLWLFLALAFGLGAAQRLREKPAIQTIVLRSRRRRSSPPAVSDVPESGSGDGGSPEPAGTG
jgi:exopolysaccharide production protein ExoQ